jgi:competence protein ComGC
MTQPVRLMMLLEALSHRVAMVTQGFVRVGMLIGLFTISIFVLPMVISLNLLTKLVSEDAAPDW